MLLSTFCEEQSECELLVGGRASPGLILAIKSSQFRRDPIWTLEPVNQSSALKPEAWLTEPACTRFKKYDPVGILKGA